MTDEKKTRGRPRTRPGPDRTARIPLGVRRAKLTARPIPGYNLRFVNDTPGRLDAAQKGGYEFVYEENAIKGEVAASLSLGNAEIASNDLGSRIRRFVGTNKDGSPQYAYLMKIPTELYEQDQAAKEAKRAVTDDLIKKGKYGDQTGRYVPEGGIRFSKV